LKRLKQYFFIKIHSQLHVSVMLDHLQAVCNSISRAAWCYERNLRFSCLRIWIRIWACDEFSARR
jgi:hypothetical protein